MTRLLLLLLCLSAIAFPAGAAVAQVAGAVAYENGQWWTGRRFRSRTMYVTDRVLRTRRPAGEVTTVDLGGRFVIPPLAEGHNHWLEPARATQYSQCHLADGVFYVRDMASIALVTDQFIDRLNRADAVDFTVGFNGFTGPGGHPVEIIDQFVAFGVLPADWEPDYDGLAQTVVRDRVDIDRGLARLAPRTPSLIKAYLLFSEDYAASLANPETRGNGRGMDPVLRPI